MSPRHEYKFVRLGARDDLVDQHTYSGPGSP